MIANIVMNSIVKVKGRERSSTSINYSLKAAVKGSRFLLLSAAADQPSAGIVVV